MWRPAPRHQNSPSSPPWWPGDAGSGSAWWGRPRSSPATAAGIATPPGATALLNVANLSARRRMACFSWVTAARHYHLHHRRPHHHLLSPHWRPRRRTLASVPSSCRCRAAWTRRQAWISGGRAWRRARADPWISRASRPSCSSATAASCSWPDSMPRVSCYPCFCEISGKYFLYIYMVGEWSVREITFISFFFRGGGEMLFN